ncbi:MAG: phospholipid carrier-dependent glycosyltransferase [Lachnospiraceae bacterium]|nr:phospholipid carrier-dependent glycosyltransferase [Lachnospiraceae bacterium]
MTRFVLYCMGETHGEAVGICLLIDALSFFYLYLLVKKDRERKDQILSLYIWNPAVLAAVFSGRTARAVMIWLLLPAGVWLVQKVKKTGKSYQHTVLFYIYALFSMGAYGIMLSEDVLDQSLVQCQAGDNQYPVLWMLMVLLVSASVVGGLWYLYKGTQKSVNQSRTAEQGEEKKQCRENQLHTSEPFGKRDILYLLILTAISTFLVFGRLGSFSSPQTGMKFQQTTDSRQMVLDFDHEVSISKIKIFLGPVSARKFSFSSFNASVNQWDVFASKQNIQSVFTWNEVEVNRPLTRLGVVSMENSDSYIYEMVILDEEGNPILPVNANQYPAVFDEQELYPQFSTYYYGTMFDEVYHARTAYEMLHGLPIYEISHPPMGKILMGIGISAFGMTPFGWRFVGGVLGVLLVPMIYLFSRQLTGKRKGACLAAMLVNLDFMHQTLSRIATIDIYVAFFIVLMFYLFYRCLGLLNRHSMQLFTQVKGEANAVLSKKLLGWRETGAFLLCGLVVGCGIATKWTAVYAACGIAVCLFLHLLSVYHSPERIKAASGYLLRLFGICFLSFIILPLTIYVLSYIPYLRGDASNNLLQIAVENSKFMLGYHKTTVADHPYSSEWFEWLWVKVPLLDALTHTEGELVSVVATFGNPIIWWGGIVALFHNFYLWRGKGQEKSGYLCISYLSMLLPWLFVHRTVFIYQYFGCALILPLMLVQSFADISWKYKRAGVWFLGAAFGAFLLFYPITSGYPVITNYICQGLRWLSRWRFV